MSAHDEEIIGKARDERDAWKRVRAKAGFAAAAVGGVALLGVPGVVLFAPALVGAGLLLNAELKLIAADRKIEDPPRPDFLKATVVEPVLPFYDAFGDSNLERLAAIAFRTLVDAVSTEEAMVLADERRQGAERFHAHEAAEARRAEHAALANAAGRLNATLEALLRALASGLTLATADWPPRATSRPRLRGSLLFQLPSGVAETLSRAGYPRDALAQELEESFELDAGLQPFVDELVAAAAATGTYGRALLRLFPDDDPEGGPTAPLLPYTPQGGGFYGLDPYYGLLKKNPAFGTPFRLPKPTA